MGEDLVEQSNRLDEDPSDAGDAGDAFWRDVLLGLALVVMTMVVYSPSFRNGFIWDDDDHLEYNLRLYQARDVGSIWTVVAATPQYYPLVFTSFLIEYQFWGLQPAGYHVDNALIQALSSLLLWRLMSRLRVSGVWLIAAIFAIHPVQTETVAWVTERKNLLCGLFTIASALAYVRFALPELYDIEDLKRRRRETSIPYIASFVLFCLAMFSKTVACTLPATFLLLIWWKRGRLRVSDVTRVVPFFVVAIGLAMITTMLEREQVGATGPDFAHDWLDRIAIAGRAVWFYAAKLIWPSPIVFFYPRWNIDPWQAPWQLLFPAAAVALIGAAWMLRRRIGRGPVVALLYFGGTLVPALSFVDFFPTRFSFVADHFQYLACIGLIALLVAIGTAALRKLDLPFAAVACVAVALLLALAKQTYSTQAMYRDATTLWTRTLELNPSAWLAANNLGVAHFDARRHDHALRLAEQAYRLKPEEPMVQTNLGLVYSAIGRKPEARDVMRRAATTQPAYAPAQRRLATVLRDLREEREAERFYRRGMALAPDDSRAYRELAAMLDAQGRTREAITVLRVGYRESTDSTIRVNLAALLTKDGQQQQAIEVLEEALQRDPENAQARDMLRQLKAATR